MKKNIIIIILIVIIIILMIKILNPSVVTQRAVSNLNNSVTSEIPSDIINSNEEQKEKEETSNEPPLRPEFRLSDDSQNTHAALNNLKEPALQSIPPQKNEQQTINEIAEEEKYDLPKEYTQEQYTDKSVNSENNSPSESNIEKNLSMCTPYKETSTSEYMGMKMNYAIEILGWQNDKCILNFESNMAGVGGSFEDVYGIPADSAQIFGFAPKIRCEFTKQQLLFVGDNILEENKKDRKMLKDPNQINIADFNNFSASDMRLLQVIFSDNACTVVNTEDFSRVLEGIFSF